ncbi:MAG: acetate/propionate family kinase [Cellvibrio sp.]|uniref:acetate/propionate family kinase n=1 Tax=Cellvibrio sp. TaxID=1965322 RepID=UPI0031B061CD
MGLAKQLILVVNGGSSSIKFAVFESGNYLRKILTGKLEGIGSAEGQFSIKAEDSDASTKTIAAKNYADATNIVMDWLKQFGKDHKITAIGHRIVHGGNNYSEPQFIDKEVLKELRRLSSLDPDHLPEEILLAETTGRLFPNIPQVACFDTVFHRDMPTIAQRLPIPRRYFDMGIKRYGFHGLSCQYLMNTLSELAGTEAARNKVILAHLGSGASVTAVYGGKSVDTSMSLTPCSGLPMSSRSGDIDPGLVLQLKQLEGMKAKQFHDMVNHESGLKGISGSSENINELLAQEQKDTHAAEAVDYFCYQTRKWICALAGAMGGVDTLIFSGGIGENLAEIRARICENLNFIGVAIDLEKNQTNNLIISSPKSQVTVRVIKTDEELVIANNVATFLDQHKGLHHERSQR